jgi:hypothetical protein
MRSNVEIASTLLHSVFRGNDRNPNGPRPAQRGSVARRFSCAIERGSSPDYDPGERAAQIDHRNYYEQLASNAVGSCGVNETMAARAAPWNRETAETPLKYQ